MTILRVMTILRS